MNKAELIDKISQDAGITKVAAARAIESIIEGVAASLHKGERTALVGFGTFTARKRKARTGRNPQTGATIKIAASKTVRFKPSKQLKASI